MIEVTASNNNYITFYSRYNQIDKFEIIDHNSKIVYSGETTAVGMDGKIQLTGFTFDFSPTETYTFKAYYLYMNKYYLATRQMIRTWKADERVDNYIKEVKQKNTYKIYGKK